MKSWCCILVVPKTHTHKKPRGLCTQLLRPQQPGKARQESESRLGKWKRASTQRHFLASCPEQRSPLPEAPSPRTLFIPPARLADPFPLDLVSSAAKKGSSPDAASCQLRRADQQLVNSAKAALDPARNSRSGLAASF